MTRNTSTKTRAMTDIKFVSGLVNNGQVHNNAKMQFSILIKDWKSIEEKRSLKRRDLLSALANRMANVCDLGSSSEKSHTTLQTQARSLPQLGSSVMPGVTEITQKTSQVSGIAGINGKEC